MSSLFLFVLNLGLLVPNFGPVMHPTKEQRYICVSWGSKFLLLEYMPAVFGLLCGSLKLSISAVCRLGMS